MNGPDGLGEFAEECLSALIVSSPIEFEYPDGCSFEYWPVNEIRSHNKELLDNLRNNGNVYALYTKKTTESSLWTPAYVGQRKSASLRERITQHLVTKNERTGSKLEDVKKAVSGGNKIAISYIKVNPESLRLYVEETIIAKRKETLPWNTHG